LAIILSVLGFTASDYPFGIFQLFLCQQYFTLQYDISYRLRQSSLSSNCWNCNRN